GKSSGGSAAYRDGIDAPFHLFKDFAGGGFVVVIGVGGVIKLGGHEGCGIGCEQVPGALDRALHALGLRSACDLGAEGAHDDDLFLGKFLGDKQAYSVAAAHANESEAYA